MGWWGSSKRSRMRAGPAAALARVARVDERDARALEAPRTSVELQLCDDLAARLRVAGLEEVK